MSGVANVRGSKCPGVSCPDTYLMTVFCLWTGVAVSGSQDYDIGAHDMCRTCIAPPISLYRLLEEQHPDMLQMHVLAVKSRNCKDILQAANAVSSYLT